MSGDQDHSRPSSWLEAPPRPHLGPGTVHVWRAPLDLDAGRLAELRLLLSDDEARRAGRFHFERDRNHFVAARGQLRLVLSRYLDAEPARRRFQYGNHGKPSLAGPAGRDRLCFNLSHSHGLALLAVTWGRELGIDVEHVRPDVNRDGLARRFFSPREVEVYERLPPEARRRAFYHCWTRKEAFVKAVGSGLTFGLEQFDVSLAPGEPAALLAVRPAAEEAARWAMFDVDVGPEYAGALAVEGRPSELHFWQHDVG